MRLLPLCVALLLIAGTAAAQSEAPQMNCTDIQAGTAKGYTCVNQQLQAIIQQTPRPSSADAPYTAVSPSNVTGQFNEDATRERLGTNFGTSVTPQRPTVTYAPAFTPPR